MNWVVLCKWEVFKNTGTIERTFVFVQTFTLENEVLMLKIALSEGYGKVQTF